MCQNYHPFSYYHRGYTVLLQALTCKLLGGQTKYYVYWLFKFSWTIPYCHQTHWQKIIFICFFAYVHVTCHLVDNTNSSFCMFIQLYWLVDWLTSLLNYHKVIRHSVILYVCDYADSACLLKSTSDSSATIVK